MSTDTVLDSVATVVEIIGGLATVLAIVVGGIWAYFKFVKGRTFRPRLEVGILGEWREIDGTHLLQTTVSVKNIGASQVELLQRGTGLRISRIADSASGQVALAWEDGPVIAILEDHAWIEPGETISDDALVRLRVTRPEPVRMDVRLVWKWHGGTANIVVNARRILWPAPDAPDRSKGGDDDVPAV